MSNESIDAGDVGASQKRYKVVHTHGHEGLALGDVVVVAEGPSGETLLVRCSDFTAHSIFGMHEQYVHLEEVK